MADRYESLLRALLDAVGTSKATLDAKTRQDLLAGKPIAGSLGAFAIKVAENAQARSRTSTCRRSARKASRRRRSSRPSSPRVSARGSSGCRRPGVRYPGSRSPDDPAPGRPQRARHQAQSHARAGALHRRRQAPGHSAHPLSSARLVGQARRPPDERGAPRGQRMERGRARALRGLRFVEEPLPLLLGGPRRGCRARTPAGWTSRPS